MVARCRCRPKHGTNWKSTVKCQSLGTLRQSFNIMAVLQHCQIYSFSSSRTHTQMHTHARSYPEMQVITGALELRVRAAVDA